MNKYKKGEYVYVKQKPTKLWCDSYGFYWNPKMDETINGKYMIYESTRKFNNHTQYILITEFNISYSYPEHCLQSVKELRKLKINRLIK